MKIRKFIQQLLLLTMVLSMFINGQGLVFAQSTTPPGFEGNPEDRERITQADREAAAERAAEGGFSLEASVPMENTTMDMDMGSASTTLL